MGVSGEVEVRRVCPRYRTFVPLLRGPRLAGTLVTVVVAAIIFQDFWGRMVFSKIKLLTKNQKEL